MPARYLALLVCLVPAVISPVTCQAYPANQPTLKSAAGAKHEAGSAPVARQHLHSKHDLETARPNDLTGQYNAYLDHLRRKIEPAWNYPPGKFSVVLKAVVKVDGSVEQTTVTSTPISEAAEAAASAAFALAQPLEPLPPRSTPTVLITVNFNSTYDPHGDSQISLSTRIDPIEPAGHKAAGSRAGAQENP